MPHLVRAGLLDFPSNPLLFLHASLPPSLLLLLLLLLTLL